MAPSRLANERAALAAHVDLKPRTVELVRQTFERTHQPPVDLDLDDDAPSSLPPPVRLLDLPPAAPRDFLVERLFPAGEVGAVVGDGDAGKTTLLLALAGAIAAGACALGALLVRPGPVLYVTGEDDADFLRNRLDALAAGHRWDRDQVLGNVHVFDDGVDLDDLRWQRHLVEAARDLHAVCAIFDPVGDLCGDRVDENSNTDARRVTRCLRAFMRATGTTPLLAMHVSKPTDGRERRHRIRGASAWRNATRSCWWVEGLDGGMELDPVKANRLAQPGLLRVKRTVATDADRALMWRVAHLALDTEGEVVGRDVLVLLRWLAACSARVSGREVEDGDHGLPRDRARRALVTASAKGWSDHVDGPRRSHLWGVTDAGRARLLLDGGRP